MKNIEIIEADSKKLVKKFIQLPFEIYKDNEYWVPPLNMDIVSRLDTKKNPFYEFSERILFLAVQNGKIVGRIAGIENRLHNEIHNENIAFFGFFEAFNNQEVANKLFEAVENWANKKGFDAVRGPANPSSNDEYGLLIEGFDDLPRLMMPYNPPYYLTLIENYGYTKAKDLLAYEILNKYIFESEKIRRGVEIVRQRTRVKIKSIDMSNFNSELKKVKHIYNNAWQPNWGFVPFTEKQIDAVAKEMKPLITQDLVIFAEIDDKPVGFALVMLDYNQIFKSMKGKLFPFGFLKLFTKKKEISWARVLILGVLPEYQKRGIDTVMYYEITERALKNGISRGEASWILEDNEMIKRGMEQLNGRIYKKFRVFEKKI